MLADLARMAAEVKAGAAPRVAGCAKLTADAQVQRGRPARPQVIAYRGVGPCPRSAWPQSCAMTRQSERILRLRARHKRRPYPLILRVCQRTSVFHISDDV